ncbi:MAG: putative viral replication protein [Cressdnaviricota sp.]|nr:MAG: putative viral replication protein [Cressdnaviricota sp.]
MNTSGAQRRNVRPSQSRLRRFVFTLNNPTDQEIEDLRNLTNVTWLILGREKGEEGTPHIQGACCLSKQMAFATLKKTAGLVRAHIEVMQGTPLQSKVYCSKDGDFEEIGELPKPGMYFFKCWSFF